jgi:hypothetical protein
MITYNKQTPILIIASKSIKNMTLLFDLMKQTEPQRLYLACDQEEEGIILDGHMPPSSGLLAFCSVLLEKYRHDERIGHISGGNYQGGIKRGNGSYYFSTLTGIWGWAGWRRVWKGYDINMNSYPLFEQMNYLEKMPGHAPFKQYWKHKFLTHCRDKSLDSWSFQYAYLNLVNNRLSIVE